jgi:hypothetical protein
VSLQIKNTKNLILRITEVGLAFCLVFILALIWSRFFAPFLESASLNKPVHHLSKQVAKNRQEGIVFDPARKNAFVRVKMAAVFTAPVAGSVPVDEIVFGREVNITDWDKTRQFVKVTTADGVPGFIHVSNLTYTKADIVRSKSEGNPAETQIKEVLQHYLGESDQVGIGEGLNFNLTDGYSRTSFSLSIFQNALRLEKSKSVVKFDKLKFGIAAFGVGPFGDGVVIFPTSSNFISQLRRLVPGTGMLIKEESAPLGQPKQPHVDKNMNFKLSFSKDVPAVQVTRESSRIISLRELDLICLKTKCQLSVKADGAVGPRPPEIMVFGDTKGLNPSLSLLDKDHLEPFGITLLDLDGDKQNDLAIYSNQSAGSQRDVDVTYVAYNNNGFWQISYIREVSLSAGDSIRLTPEPGSYDEPLVVSITSQRGFGIAYSIDGRDPECPVMDAALSSINQADVLLENTTQLKVKSCSRQEGESELVSANYTIN